MERVLAFLRVNGRFSYQYGPKSFDMNWNGAFTALEVIDRISRWRTGVKGALPSKRAFGSAGGTTQALKKSMLIEELETVFATQNVDHMYIVKEVKHRLAPCDCSARFVQFSPREQAMAFLTRSLSDMSLNQWGVLQQICLALSSFPAAESEADHLCMSIFFNL
jgi:hypothetical protein